MFLFWNSNFGFQQDESTLKLKLFVGLLAGFSRRWKTSWEILEIPRGVQKRMYILRGFLKYLGDNRWVNNLLILIFCEGISTWRSFRISTVKQWNLAGPGRLQVRTGWRMQPLHIDRMLTVWSTCRTRSSMYLVVPGTLNNPSFNGCLVKQPFIM